jgi:uncharacterized membrane protein YheB (UPF0754 family)
MSIEVLYQQVLLKSRRMHDLASNAAWDDLIAAELERRRAVSQLRETLEEQAEDALSESLKQQIQQCIQETLALDRETEKLVNDWMRAISQELTAVGTAQRMRRAYAGG